MKKTERINFKAAIITVLCTLLDLTGRYFAVRYKLPLWGDSLGTVLAAYVLGPFSGAVVGALACIMLSFADYRTAFFSIVGIGIGLGTGFFARRGAFKTYFNAVTCAIAVTSYTFISSSILDLVIWGGTTGNLWEDAVISYFRNIGLKSTVSCFIGQFYLEFVDKFLTVSLLYLLLKAYRAMKGKKPEARKALPLLLAVILPATVLAGSLNVHADTVKGDNSSVMKVYDASNGLTPGHATSIAATGDGRLWIGTYAGLYSYDGQAFRLFDSKKILNVNCLFTDREGRLWVGTNGSGLSIIINGELVSSIDTLQGLPVNSIRSITQASDGRYYVGTSCGMVVLSLSNGLSVTDRLDQIEYCTSSAALDNGMVAAIGGDGGLYLIKDGRIISSRRDGDYSAVAFMSDGTICAGTNNGRIDEFSLEKRSLKRSGRTDCGSHSTINFFLEDKEGGVEILCDNGVYSRDQGGKWTRVSTGDFDSALQTAVRDYQGNLWIASTRKGLLEISSSAYTDFFSLYGIEADTANAVLLDGDLLYAGCDSGLVIMDRVSGKRIENRLSRKLKKKVMSKFVLTKSPENGGIIS